MTHHPTTPQTRAQRFLAWVARNTPQPTTPAPLRERQPANAAD